MGMPYRGGPAAGLDSPREVNIVRKQNRQNEIKKFSLYYCNSIDDIHRVTFSNMQLHHKFIPTNCYTGNYNFITAYQKRLKVDYTANLTKNLKK